MSHYQGDPQRHFRIFYTAQAPNAPAPPPNPHGIPGGCPAAGLTNQQCWDTYKKATAMELAPCTDTTTHPEILGFVCASTAPPPVPQPPVITMQPHSLTATAGASVSFSITATGTAPLSYRSEITWRIWT